MKDESPPMLAIYLLLAFLSLQYASSLFNTNQFVYQRNDDEYKKLADQLTQILQVLNREAPPSPLPVPAPVQPEVPKVARKRHQNKISQDQSTVSDGYGIRKN